MNAVAIIAIIAVCVMVIGPLAGNVIALLMMEEIYRNKPNSDLCFRNLWDRAFGFRILREYRSLCPHGKLHIYELACVALAIVHDHPSNPRFD
jgi:hypothetical protein